jgi:hypothetical protein
MRRDVIRRESVALRGEKSRSRGLGSGLE